MSRSYLVTGGAGFIGANYAHHLLGRGERVTLLDNLSRRARQPRVAAASPPDANAAAYERLFRSLLANKTRRP